jgi:hypothetical protein
LLTIDAVAASECWLLGYAMEGGVGVAIMLGTAYRDRVPGVVVAALGCVALEENEREDSALELTFTADDWVRV